MIGFSSPAEIAKAFAPAISENACRHAIESGAMKSYKFARHRIILADDVVSFIRTLPAYTRRTSHARN